MNRTDRSVTTQWVMRLPGSRAAEREAIMGVLMSGMQAFAQNVWTIDGPNVRDFGVVFTTRMTVVLLSDGSVWVNSPVPVPFETLKRITELGPVRFLVAAPPEHV